jgi:pimeloyl-ACP methyl ester carboxylesterase
MNLHFRCGLPILALLAASFALPQGRPLPQEKTAVVFDQNIRYFEAGQGSAIILLHGMGGTKESGMENFGALAAGYHVYAIDQIGFAHSDRALVNKKPAKSNARCCAMRKRAKNFKSIHNKRNLRLISNTRRS